MNFELKKWRIFAKNTTSMFTTGRIIFASLFVVAFVIFMVISYRKDARNHKTYYKNAAKKVAIYGTIAIVLFVALRYLTAVVF
jgi:cytochrome bd-type quinol oxidase subunit 1